MPNISTTASDACASATAAGNPDVSLEVTPQPGEVCVVPPTFAPAMAWKGVMMQSNVSSGHSWPRYEPTRADCRVRWGRGGGATVAHGWWVDVGHSHRRG
jgi:hypothetical protein